MTDTVQPPRRPRTSRGPSATAKSPSGPVARKPAAAAAKRPANKRPPKQAAVQSGGGAAAPSNAKRPQRLVSGSPLNPLVALKRIDWARVRERAWQYALLARVDKPIGMALLLWPTWWALWLAASDFPPWGKLVIFTLGVFLMRSAGCVINDYADRKLDPNVARTRERPIATGKVKPREALSVFLGLITAAFLLVLFTNRLTIELSLVGALLAVTYPFMKRYTHLPQVYLGATFGWSIPMAFAAVSGKLTQLTWLLFLANVLWTTIYDTQYAMVDRDDDIRIGAKSTAILFGDADRAILGVLMATFLFAMVLVGSRAGLHWPFFASVAIAGGLFVYQQWLIRGRERDACFAAFRNNNWVGLVLFTGIALHYALQ